jgi:K+-sensing histidine kinase KdpD
MTAVIVDNAWKHSFGRTALAVRVHRKPGPFVDISFTNTSKPIPPGVEIFAKGVKGNSDTNGFGFGLSWATILVDCYNSQVGRVANPLGITHRQTLRDDGLADQCFTLVNADLQMGNEVS